MRISYSLSVPTRASQSKQKRFFTGQVADWCNSLPKGVVEVTGLRDFKGVGLDKFLGEESTGGS